MTEWTAAQILATTVIKTTTNNWAKGYNAMASLKKPKFLQPTIAIVTWPNYYSHTIAKKPCRRIGQIQKCPIILRSGKKKTKWLLFLLERGWNGSREKQAKYRYCRGYDWFSEESTKVMCRIVGWHEVWRWSVEMGQFSDFMDWTLTTNIDEIFKVRAKLRYPSLS